MNKIVAAACAAVLVISLYSEKCYSLEYNLENSDNVIDSQNIEAEHGVETEDLYDIEDRLKPLNPLLNTLFRSKDEKQDGNIDGGVYKRVVRQAYQGKTQLYPNLPSGPPYGQEPYSNYNNPNPYYNPQSQQPYNSNYNSYGYTPPTNGYQPTNNSPYGTHPQFQHSNNTQAAFPFSNSNNPGNLTNNYSPSPYGQAPKPNLWQPNYPSNNNQRSFDPPNRNYPSYNYNTSNSHSGYKPINAYNNSNSGLPYYQSVSFNNSSYPGSSSHTPSYMPVATPNPTYPYNPNHRPQQYPVQNHINNTRYAPVVPGNQHPVIYDESTKRPGQNPYGVNNVSNWNSYNSTQGRPYNIPGYRPVATSTPAYPYNPNQNSQYYPGQNQPNNTRYPQMAPRQNPYGVNNVSNWNSFNSTQGRPPYNAPGGQNQYYNSYPGSPGFGSQNSMNPNYYPSQGQLYQQTNFGQNATTNYPGHPPGSATFNLASGYNPSIPNKPTYGNVSPYGISPYGNGPSANQPFKNPGETLYDPTKVSPQHFNSF